jgi:hypothetical protein
MKLFKYICTLACLLGFTLSLLQCLPLKLNLQKMEMSKKMSDSKKEAEDEKDGKEKDDEADSDSELSDLIDQFSELEWKTFYSGNFFYHRSDLNYFCTLSKIPTPPPEV